jgi:hypothetical protein
MPNKIEKILRKTNISLWLDHYDNIFSDFDPRAYSQRALSDDFLNEAKKVTFEIKPGMLDLKLLIPKEHREHVTEHVIRERLHSHFKKAYLNLEKEHSTLVKRGITLVVAGLISLLIATAVNTLQNQTFFISFIRVLLEPAGWFTAWYGLDLIFYESKETKQELDFCKKMAHAEIDFDGYNLSSQ